MEVIENYFRTGNVLRQRRLSADGELQGFLDDREQAHPLSGLLYWLSKIAVDDTLDLKSRTHAVAKLIRLMTGATLDIRRVATGLI